MIYLKEVVWGDLGEGMINTGRNVPYYIKIGLPVTACLRLIASVLAPVGGITLEARIMLSRYKWVNSLCIFVIMIGVSVPSSLIATIMLIMFRIQLHALSFIGLNSPPNYIVLALSLASYPIVTTAKLVHSSMLEVMNQNCIILAHSKDTPYEKVAIKYALKNVMLSVATCAGPTFVLTLTGSFVIGSVFSIPDIGSASVSCTITRDYPIIMGLTIFLGFPVVTFNLATDILSVIIDSWIKLD